MKHHTIIIATAILLLASCATNYVATDSVDRHLGGTRQILTSSRNDSYFDGWRTDSLDVPLAFDFRSEKDTMRYAYTISIVRDGWTVKMDSLPRMLQPEVTVGHSFRWFTTRYHYTARFPQLDSLPVPIGDYLTPDEQRLLFSPNELPNDWTGTDLYSLLDKLNTKYVQWWNHCLFEKEIESYAPYCDSTQQALLAKYHDTLLAIILKDLPDNRKSIGNEASRFPELDFICQIERDDDGLSYSAFAWAYAHWDIATRVIWRTELPGGFTTEHMVSVDRMITGDYIIEEHSDRVNWWAIALTLLLLAAGAILLARKR